MATTPNKDKVPSNAVQNLLFNSEKMDEVINSESYDYVDRLGKNRRTLAGIDQDANRAMSSYGYITKDSFEAGNTLDTPNAVLRWRFNGEFYRWDGDWTGPKVVPAGSTPMSTGGAISPEKPTGSWTSVGDGALRTELSKSGGELVNIDPLGDYSPGTIGHYLKTILGFVTPDNFTGTDQQKIEQWLRHGGNLFLDRTYQLTAPIDIAINNAIIDGAGKLQTSLKVSSATTIVTLRGSRNQIKRLNIEHTGDMRDCGRIFLMVGHKNEISIPATFLKDFNPRVEGEQYLGAFVALDGNYNTASRCLAENGGTGVEENGIGNTVENNTILNCCRGIINGRRSRSADVGHNNIDLKHKGFPLQSCDGIWGDRSHRGTRYYNNTINNAGEHGAYLQGDSFVWESTNTVDGSQKCMMKIGAKADGNYQYAGEVLPLFNVNGLPDPNGVYATTAATISPKGTGNNISNGSDGVVCIQPNVASLDINDAGLEDNLSDISIRSLYFSGESGKQVMGRITINGGSSIRSGNTVLSGVNVKANGYVTGGDIVFSAQNAPILNDPAKLINCEASTIRFNASFRGLRIKDGKYRAINEGSGLDIRCNGVEITNQDLSGSWANSRVVSLVNCDVTFNGDGILNINGVSESLGTTYKLPDATQQYALQYNTGLGIRGSKFDGNTVTAPKAARPFRFNGNRSTCSNNTILGLAISTEYSITITGDNVTAVGNEHDGNLRLESTATNCFVVDRKVSNGNSGGGNKVLS